MNKGIVISSIVLILIIIFVYFYVIPNKDKFTNQTRFFGKNWFSTWKKSGGQTMIKIIIFFTRFLFFKVFLEKLIVEYQIKQLPIKIKTPKEIADEALKLPAKIYHQPKGNL